MRRFFLPPEQLTAEAPLIAGPDANHIKNVLRLKPGTRVAVTDGRGGLFAARIAAIRPEGVAIAIEGPLADAGAETAADAPAIRLAQGLLKSGKMDDLLRQAVELGITHWMPFQAARSVPTPDAARMENRRLRWEKIAREAIKQCRRNRLPDIAAPAPLESILDAAEECDLRLLFWEGAKSPADLFALRNPTRPYKDILLLIGPEGGLTTAEADAARARGFHMTTLGPRILRAETAAVAACALVQYLFGDLAHPPPTAPAGPPA